jgi:uncharacterized protein
MGSQPFSQHFLFDFAQRARIPVKIFFALFLMFFIYLAITFTSIFLAVPIFRISWADLNNTLANGLTNADISLIKYFQLSQTLGLFLIPAVLMNFLFFDNEERFLSYNQFRKPIFILLLVIISLIVSIPLISKLIEWNNSIHFPEFAGKFEALLKEMEEERNDLTERMLDGKQIKDLMYNIFLIAVLPALGEEFIFRGVLQQFLTRWFRNTHWAILITAILFSAIHFQFYGFVPRLLLGLYFGYLFYWGKNIWIPVFAHFINNSTAVILLFIENSKKINLPDMLKEDYKTGIAEVIISFGLTVLIIISIRTIFQRRKEV